MPRGMTYSYAAQPEQLTPEEAAAKAQEYYARGLQDINNANFCFCEAIRLKKDFIPAYVAMASYQLECGRYKQAITYAKEALDMKPDYVEAHIIIGLSQAAMGDTMGCVELCEKVSEIKPDFADAYNVKGEMLMELGMYQNALAAYDKAIELNPQGPFVYGNKGYVLSLLGKTDEAIELYNKHLEISPQDFTVWIKKGQALQTKGNAEEALKCYSSATELFLKGYLFYMTWRIEKFSVFLNQHEVKLLHCLRDLLKIKEIKTILKEDEIAELEEKRSLLQMKIFQGFTNKSQNNVDDKIKFLMEEVQALNKKTQELEKDIRDSGAKDLAMVKRGFKELEEKDAELLSYCKTFYWTSINLFGAYRTASIGLMKGDKEHGEKLTDNLLSDGVKKSTRAIADVSKGIPFVEGVVSLLNSVIDDLVDIFKENKDQKKVNAINKIIQKKLGLESDISVNVAKVALVITQAKEKTILHPELSEKPSNLSKGVNWLTTQIDSIKEKVLPSVELHDPNSRGATLALQDVTLLMAYLTKNSDAVVTGKEPLDKQLEAIIQFGGLDKMLESKSPAEISKKRPQGACCTIF